MEVTSIVTETVKQLPVDQALTDSVARVQAKETQSQAELAAVVAAAVTAALQATATQTPVVANG